MAKRRKYKQPSIVSGKSIQDIIYMDIDTFNRLNTKDLRKVVGRLVSAGNKRLRSFERAGEKSPATRHIYNTGGAFSTKGKDLNALRSEYMRARNFLRSETGTRRGWKSVQKRTIEELSKQGVKLTLEQFNDMWETYEKLKEMSPEVATRGLKYNVLQDITTMLIDDKKTPEEIARDMQKRLTHIYEEQAEAFNGIDGVSGFFEI